MNGAEAAQPMPADDLYEPDEPASLQDILDELRILNRQFDQIISTVSSRFPLLGLRRRQ